MIPKKFNILGHTVNVIMDKDLHRLTGNMGEACKDLNTIRLAPSIGIDILPTSMVEHTYFHEIVHIILDSMNENELSANESFVDMFGGLLYQVLKTSK